MAEEPVIPIELDCSMYYRMINYADIFFEVGGSKIGANKCVLCEYSDYFKALIKNSRSNQIEITNITSEKMFLFIIKLIYSKTIKTGGDNETIEMAESQLMEALLFLHQSLDNELFKYVFRIYNDKATVIQYLCHLKNFVEGEHLKFLIRRLRFIISGKEYLEFDIDDLNKEEWSFLINHIDNDVLIKNFGINVLTNNIDINEVDLKYLSNYIEEFSITLGKEVVLAEFFKRRKPQVYPVGDEMIILFPVFWIDSNKSRHRSSSSYSAISRTRSKTKSRHKHDSEYICNFPVFSGYDIVYKNRSIFTRYTIESIDKEGNIKIGKPSNIEFLITTTEGKTFKKRDAKYLYYAPKNLKLHEFNT